MKKAKLSWQKYFISIFVFLISLVALRLSAFQSGNEFQVNTYTEGTQWRQKIAMNSKGNFIVIWNNSPYGTLGKWGTYFQRFNINGKYIGKETQVFKDYIEGYADNIAMDKRGNFVVVYDKTIKGLGEDIFAQRFNKKGMRKSTEIKVNTNDYGCQENPAIAMNSKGNFAIAWQSAGYDGSKLGIFTQRFNKKGMPLNTEFQVNTYAWDDQKNPAVAMGTKGDFVIVWQSEKKGGEGDSSVGISTDSWGKNFGIFAQRFDKNGNPLGTEFKVNTYHNYDQINPTIAIDSKGNFIIVWQSEKQDGESYGIFARRYNNNGEPIDLEFQVNSTIFKDQTNPAIAVDSQGNFVIVWQSYYYIKAAKRYFDIFGRRFNSDGIPIGTEFQINTYTKDDQCNPVIAMDSNGNFIIAWESMNQDGSRSGIFAKIFKK